MIDSFAQEQDNKILWLPVLIGIGIIISPAAYGKEFLILITALFIFSVFLRNRLLSYVILLIGTGVATFYLRVHMLDTKFISEPLYAYKIIAKVHEINQKGKFTQIVLKDLKHYKLTGLTKIRIRAYNVANNVKSGDIVSFSAKLNPPPNMVSPYAYNFARFAYFKGIGAVGFAVTPVTLCQSMKNNFLEKVDSLRNYIANSFIDIMGSRNGNIASALIVGKKQGIDLHIMDNIRKSGLAHLLAISGLHLTIVAFFFFVFFRKLFSLSMLLANKYNIKKWAAILGIISSAFYLIVAGMPISAQRAFIMVLITLIAILIDRNSSSIRSIAVSATIILLLEPESIFMPSFQMSFAAVIALCSFYETYKTLYIHNMFYRLTGYFSSIALSSLVASLATTPYTIYHFNYLSLGGIISNLIAIPLTTLIILPCGIISVILIPTGLAEVTGFIMSQGINIIIYLSRKIGTIHYSAIPVHIFDDISVLVITGGFLWLCLWRQRWRLIGIPIILIGIIIGVNYQTPDVWVDKKTVAVKGSDGQLYFLSKQRKNFVNNTWINQNGQRKMHFYNEHKNNDSVSINCNRDYCEYYNRGKSVLFLYSSSSVGLHDFDYILQLKDFPIRESDKLIPYKNIENGCFIWLVKDKIENLKI